MRVTTTAFLGLACLAAAGVLASVWLERYGAAAVSGLWCLALIHLAWMAREDV